MALRKKGNNFKIYSIYIGAQIKRLSGKEDFGMNLGDEKLRII